MTADEILRQIYDNTVLGKAPEVTNLTKEGLAQNIDPLDLLYGGPTQTDGGRGLLPALQEVGRRFEVVKKDFKRSKKGDNDDCSDCEL